MCGFYCIGFIEYMIAGKALLNYTSFLSPDNYKENEKTVYKYFKDKRIAKEDANLEFRIKN